MEFGGFGFGPSTGRGLYCSHGSGALGMSSRAKLAHIDSEAALSSTSFRKQGEDDIEFEAVLSAAAVCSLMLLGVLSYMMGTLESGEVHYNRIGFQRLRGRSVKSVVRCAVL